MRLFHNISWISRHVNRRFCSFSSRSFLGRTFLDVHQPVRHALERGNPVVALESTIITHGMPYPDNVNTALEVEDIIREEGVVPATIGVLDGHIRVGLQPDEIDKLGRLGEEAKKIARRDLAVATSQKLSGGTTVSATMIAAHLSGIDVFVTGGIGGVHRGAEITMDVSSDLTELGKTPVAVVCGGVKSLLDIRLTLEYLETQGVTVATLGETIEFPAFFTPQSGMKSDCQVRSPQECAKLIFNNFELGLNSGLVVAVPIPHNSAAYGVEEVIQDGLDEVNRLQVTGSEVTPFLLDFVNRRTKGQSLVANIALVKNNARVGALIAKELSFLKHQFAITHSQMVPTKLTKSNLSSKSSFTVGNTVKRPVVIGASVVDFVATAESEVLHEGTTCGKVTQSYGGVGRNVAECLARLDAKPLLITAVGRDFVGESLLHHWTEDVRADAQGITTLNDYNTATYSGMFHGTGDLHAAVGDMTINDTITTSMVSKYEKDMKAASLVCMDGNVPPATVRYVADFCATHNVPVWFEPTCIMKAKRPVEAGDSWQKLTYISPNFSELQSFCSAIGMRHISDSDKLRTSVIYSHQLLDFIPYILVTLGSDGVLVCRNSLLSGRSYLHFPPATSDLLPVDVINVSGAGDSFAGVMMSCLIRGLSLPTAIKGGLKAAFMSLHTTSAVSRDIRPEEFTEASINSWAPFSPDDVSTFVD